MPPVISSNIASVDWDAGTLDVKFKTGDKYRYFEVPHFYYEDFLNADSKGKYFDQKIKKGGFKYEKLDPQSEREKIVGGLITKLLQLRDELSNTAEELKKLLSNG